MRNNYTQEHIDWLINFYPNHNQKETISAFKEIFGLELNPGKLQGLVHKLQLKTRGKEYTEEESAWLRENAGKMPYKDFVKVFNSTFNENKTYEGIRGYCSKKLGVFVGKNAFTRKVNADDLISLCLDNPEMRLVDVAKLYNERNGTNLSYNTLAKAVEDKKFYRNENNLQNGNEKSLGSTRVNAFGFEIVKVSRGQGKNKGWRTLASCKYEEYHHCKLEKDEYVIFANGNLRDYSKDNLIKVTKGEHLKLNNDHFSNKGEITKAALDIIRAKDLINALRNQ